MILSVGCAWPSTFGPSALAIKRGSLLVEVVKWDTFSSNSIAPSPWIFLNNKYLRLFLQCPPLIVEMHYSDPFFTITLLHLKQYLYLLHFDYRKPDQYREKWRWGLNLPKSVVLKGPYILTLTFTCTTNLTHCYHRHGQYRVPQQTPPIRPGNHLPKGRAASAGSCQHQHP